MKLRFRENGLRLRLNRPEVARLASGGTLEECVLFPGNTALSYLLGSAPDSSPQASFRDGAIRITAPKDMIAPWAADDTIGIYFDVPAGSALLKIAIEKDLECLDAPPEERDPDAFPRAGKSCG
ncbi:MAG TPA: hypothetical protein VF283_20060 [Bryobacteraceae bacterium]